MTSKPHQALLVAALLLVPAAPAQSPLTTLQDHHRVLLVFAPASSAPQFTKQQELLKNRASDLMDRDLIVIPVLTTWTTADSGLRDENVPFTSQAEQNNLRHRFNTNTQTFTVILLGKDGGEKLRSSTPVTMEKLAALIDSMPMRQQELRQRSTHASSK